MIKRAIDRSLVAIKRRSIYAEALKRKGAGDYRQQLAELHVRDLMKRDPITVSPVAHFAEIGEKFIANRFNYLYVTKHGRFLGAVSLHDIKNYLNSPELAKVVIAEDLLHGQFPVIPAGSTLAYALEIFTHHDGERLPVIGDISGRQLVGSISKTDLILALADINRSAPTDS